MCVYISTYTHTNIPQHNITFLSSHHLHIIHILITSHTHIHNRYIIIAYVSELQRHVLAWFLRSADQAWSVEGLWARWSPPALKDRDGAFSSNQKSADNSYEQYFALCMQCMIHNISWYHYISMILYDLSLSLYIYIFIVMYIWYIHFCCRTDQVLQHCTT